MRAFPPMLASLFVAVISLSCTADSSTDVGVPGPVASLSVAPTDAVVQVGTSTQLSAIARDSSGDTLSGQVTAWTSSDVSVARVVRTAGIVIGVAPGSAEVIANVGGKSARAAITVTSSPPPPPTISRYGVFSGVSFRWDPSQSGLRATLLAQLRNLHPQVARISLLWAYTERTKGTLDWAVYDQVVDSLVAAGIDPLFVVNTSPPWANGSTDFMVVPTDPAAFTAWVADYKAFVTAAATRYKGRVKLWELGNEMNDAPWWKPAPNVQQYATWFTALNSALLTVDPQNQVASGGLTLLRKYLDNPVDGWSGRTFLQMLYDLGVYPKHVAIHPYANTGAPPDESLAGNEWISHFDDIALMRDVMIANGQSSATLWVTEWGWRVGTYTNAAWGVPDVTIDEALQATYVRASLDRLVALYPYVSIATYFSQFDASDTYGLYRADGTAKPAAAAFVGFFMR